MMLSKDVLWQGEHRRVSDHGLAHAHILPILAAEDALLNCDDCDSIVCAEIPHEAESPCLYQIVSCCVMHGHVVP